MEVGRGVKVAFPPMLAVDGLVFNAVATSYCIALGRAVKGKSMSVVLSHTGGILPHQRWDAVLSVVSSP